MKTNTVVLVLLGAVGLGLVGGILGGMIIGGDGADPALSTEVSALESRIDELEAMEVAAGPRVSFVDAEGLFMDVFIPQVAAERELREEKQQELLVLRQRYGEGELAEGEYQEQYLITQTEVLQAELQVNLSMLDKMLASDGFEGMRGQLQEIKRQAEPLDAEMERLLEQARAGVLDPEGYMSQLQAVNSATQQIDQILTQAAAQKIVEVSQQVARDEGYDLALRKKEVVVYWDEDTVADISGEVRPLLEELFAGS
ncbi:MAG: hypothetical protein R6U88_06580 [Candidatus Bipolaricaulota bacterium]